MGTPDATASMNKATSNASSFESSNKTFLDACVHRGASYAFQARHSWVCLAEEFGIIAPVLLEAHALMASDTCSVTILCASAGARIHVIDTTVGRHQNERTLRTCRMYLSKDRRSFVSLRIVKVSDRVMVAVQDELLPSCSRILAAESTKEGQDIV
jgi:hypothetical protein